MSMSLVDFHGTVARQFCVENLRTEFHENPTDDLVVTLDEGRTDGDRSVNIQRFYFVKMYNDSFQ